MLDIVIKIPKVDGELVDALLGESLLEAEKLSGAGFDGGGDWITLLASISTASLTALVTILKAKWARAKNVVIEVDGMKVKGANPEEIKEILGQMINSARIKKSNE